MYKIGEIIAVNRRTISNFLKQYAKQESTRSDRKRKIDVQADRKFFGW